MEKIRKRSEIPVEDTWATEDLYATDEAWERELATLTGDQEALCGYAGRLSENPETLYDYMEKSGFQFKFYDGFDRDEVDRSIKDIQDTNRRLILESTGLQQLLEDMIRQKAETTDVH